MTKTPKGEAPKPETYPDAWKRFERAVDVVAKSPPQPKKKNKSTSRPCKASPDPSNGDNEDK
jgi:hypothetical protein